MMVRTFKIYACLLSFLICFSCIHAQKDNRSDLIRLLNSTNEDFLIKDASPEGEKCVEKANYLGMLYDYKILIYDFDYGINCKRVTYILVYHTNDEYCGYYYTNGYIPTQIMNKGLLFDEEIVGDFTNGIPDTLKIDGIDFSFEKKK